MAQDLRLEAEKGVPNEVMACSIARSHARSGLGTVAVIAAHVAPTDLLGLHVSAVEYDEFLDLLHLLMRNDACELCVVLSTPIDQRSCTLLLQALDGGGVFVASPDDQHALVRLAFGDGSFGRRQPLRNILHAQRERLVQTRPCW